jgi:hypothetical protein
VAGLWRSRPREFSIRARLVAPDANENGPAKWGRFVLALTAASLILAGTTIAVFGMMTVFVPSDLRFIGLDRATLSRLSPMLIPLISHDRAGFGGGLCSIGSFLLFVARFAELNRSLIEIIAVMGCAGFGCAIGVHFAVGYLDFFHLLPAFIGMLMFVLADVLFWLGNRRFTARSSQARGRSGHPAARRKR